MESSRDPSELKRIKSTATTVAASCGCEVFVCLRFWSLDFHLTCADQVWEHLSLLDSVQELTIAQRPFPNDKARNAKAVPSCLFNLLPFPTKRTLLT